MSALQPKPPPREAWDFDLGGCPANEIEHCCVYEYGLEHPAVQKLVIRWRKNSPALMQSGDVVGNLIRDTMFGSLFRVLVDHPEFPAKHWLQIAPDARKSKVRKFPPRSRLFFPNDPPKYEGPGPENAARVQLDAQLEKWKTIKKETETLDNLFRDAHDNESLRTWPVQLHSQLAYYLNKEEVTKWTGRLSKLSGKKLYLTAEKLRADCEKRIHQRCRERVERVGYEIDWTLRPKELKERFGEWAEANRVHPPREKSGGHPTKPIELLKALGAKRLLDFFRTNQKNLPQPYKAQTLHEALSDYTRDMRKAARRPVKPLYSKPSGWIDARGTADTCLARF